MNVLRLFAEDLLWGLSMVSAMVGLAPVLGVVLSCGTAVWEATAPFTEDEKKAQSRYGA